MNDITQEKIDAALQEEYGGIKGIDLPEIEKAIFNKDKIENENVLNEVKKILRHAKSVGKEGAVFNITALTDLQDAYYQLSSHDKRKAYDHVNSANKLAESTINKLFEFATNESKVTEVLT